MKLVLKTCAAAVIASFVCASATAQTPLTPPTYGTVNLNVGFMPDPHVTSLQAGGSIDARGLAILAERGDIFGNAVPQRGLLDCRGYIAYGPDLRVNYAAGTTLPLIFSVNSSSDTTLVVNSPDGGWHCNNDGGEGLNPSLRFDPPQSGQYDIWVGAYVADVPMPAELTISETGSH